MSKQIYGEHGRELISSESGLSFLQRVRGLEDFAVKGKPTEYKEKTEAIQKGYFEAIAGDSELVSLLEHVSITVLPMENPNGRDVVEVRLFFVTFLKQT